MRHLEPNDLIDKVIRIKWGGKWDHPERITSIGTGTHGESVAILARWKSRMREWNYRAERVSSILNSVARGLSKVSSR